MPTAAARNESKSGLIISIEKKKKMAAYLVSNSNSPQWNLDLLVLSSLQSLLSSHVSGDCSEVRHNI